MNEKKMSFYKVNNSKSIRDIETRFSQVYLLQLEEI